MENMNTVCALCLNGDCFLLHSSIDLLQGIEIGILIKNCYGLHIEHVKVCGDCITNLDVVNKIRNEALKSYEIYESIRNDYVQEREKAKIEDANYEDMEFLEDVDSKVEATSSNTTINPDVTVDNGPSLTQINEIAKNDDATEEEPTEVQNETIKLENMPILISYVNEESTNQSFSDDADIEQCGNCGNIMEGGTSSCSNCNAGIDEKDWTTDEQTENSNAEWLDDESLYKNKEGESHLYTMDNMTESDMRMLEEHAQSMDQNKQDVKYDGECTLCGSGSNTSVCLSCTEVLERPKDEQSLDIFEDEDEDDNLPSIEHRKHCYICSTNVTNLKNHFKEKHFDTELFCKICNNNVKFENIWKLELHSQFHNPRRPLVCKSCPMRFYKDDKRKAHEQKVHVAKPSKNVVGFPCRFCGKVMKTRPNMLVHEKQIHTSHRHFPCPYPGCGKILSSTQALRGHRIIMHSKDFKHICEFCGRGFITPTNLKEHRRINHSSVKEFQCEKCKREFKSLKYMKSHYRPNGECVKPRGSLMCEVCEEWLEGEEYENHMGQLHPDVEYIFHCRRCPSKFQTRWEWESHEAREKQRHERNKYLEMRKYQCDLCDKAFGAKNRLIKHRSTHTGEKFYKCACCDFTCEKKEDMEIHNKDTFHERNRGIYTCEFCKKEFKHGGNLKLHRRTHISDSSIFACFRCGKDYPNQGTLDKHVRRNSCVIEVE